MSKENAKEKIGIVKNQKVAGKNTAEVVGKAMEAIVDAIPNPVSENGNPEIDYVTEKVWKDGNEEIRKNIQTTKNSIPEVVSVEGTATNKAISQDAWTKKNQLITNSIPKVVSVEGAATNQAVSQKAWTDKNRGVVASLDKQIADLESHIKNNSIHLKYTDKHLDDIVEFGIYYVTSLNSSDLYKDEIGFLIVDTTIVFLDQQTLITNARYVKRSRKDDEKWTEWESIHDVVSEEGSSTDKAISQKAWTDKNKELNSSLNAHTQDGMIHFSASSDISNMDLIVNPGIYKVSFYGFEEMSGKYNGVLAISEPGSRKTMQTLFFEKGIYKRLSDSFNLNPEGGRNWSKWESVIPISSATEAGLMSIDHYKSVEDMITNFSALVESQTEIKGQLENISKELTNNDVSNWDTSVIVTTVAQETDMDEWKNIISFLYGTDKETKAIYADGKEFTMKSDVYYQLVPIRINTQENSLIAYNKNSTRMNLWQPGGRNRIKRLVVISATLDSIIGNYCFVRDLDVTKCPNLKTLLTSGYDFKTINLKYNEKLEELTLGEGGLESLDLRSNPLIKKLSLARLDTKMTVDISNCLKLDIFNLLRNRRISLDDIKFPATFRPTMMNIQDTAFTYDNVVALADKYSGDTTSKPVVLYVDEGIEAQLQLTGQMALFSLKEISVTSVIN